MMSEASPKTSPKNPADMTPVTPIPDNQKSPDMTDPTKITLSKITEDLTKAAEIIAKIIGGSGELNLPKELLTLANLVTIFGALLTIYGIKDIDKPKGCVKIALGRFLDTLDGTLARRLGQESQTGAALDAATDKLVTLMAVYEMHRKKMAPNYVLATVAFYNILNSIFTAAAKLQDPDAELRPSKDGKIGLALQTASIVSHLASELLGDKNSQLPKWLKRMGDAALLAAILPSTRATNSYAERAAEAIKKKKFIPSQCFAIINSYEKLGNSRVSSQSKNY